MGISPWGFKSPLPHITLILKNDPSKETKILLLGIGNLLLGDEGLGVQVIERLKNQYIFPDTVTLLEGGTGAFYLLPYIEKAEYLLIIDAIKGGGNPGTLYFFNLKEVPMETYEKISLHDVSLPYLLNLLHFKGKIFKEIWIAGIEPLSIEPSLNLSKKVEREVDRLIKKILAKLKDWGIPYFSKESAI